MKGIRVRQIVNKYESKIRIIIALIYVVLFSWSFIIYIKSGNVEALILGLMGITTWISQRMDAYNEKKSINKMYVRNNTAVRINSVEASIVSEKTIRIKVKICNIASAAIYRIAYNMKINGVVVHTEVLNQVQAGEVKTIEYEIGIGSIPIQEGIPSIGKCEVEIGMVVSEQYNEQRAHYRTKVSLRYNEGEYRILRENGFNREFFQTRKSELKLIPKVGQTEFVQDE